MYMSSIENHSRGLSYSGQVVPLGPPSDRSRLGRNVDFLLLGRFRVGHGAKAGRKRGSMSERVRVVPW